MLCCLQSEAQQTERLYLSGTGSDQTVNWEFFCTNGMNANKWSTIPVPSCWELQGFGKYDYGFARDSVRGKEKGMYKYSFKVPAAWSNKTVRIVFEGSMTDTEVFINGQSAGPIHQGAFYAFNYDITNLLRFNDPNLLEVTVSKHSANESVNAAERRCDYWIFGGIFRPVYLEAFPRPHIERVAIDARADGKFSANVFANGDADKVSVQLYAPNGTKYGPALTQRVTGEITTVTGKFASPSLWSSEFPHLYRTEFVLYQKGKPVHIIHQKFGFRTVEVKERDGVYINGVKVKMKGVNRHSFRPASGRTTSRTISVEDVLLMKEMNMNAVRMSHYPPDGHFLDVCDSLGLYVMDELAGWHGHYDTETGTKLLKEMIRHDVNHPSIIFWANGNEGGHNLDLDELFGNDDIQQRPVLHPWQVFGGFDTQHYREYNYGIGNYDHGHEIVMPTEFLHGMYDGGHGAGLEDYWEAMWNNPMSAGGFLWDFADQGVIRTDKNGMIDTDGSRGADGIVGPNHEKEGSFYAIKQIWSPIVFERKEITDEFNGRLNIENRYHFTNTMQCRFQWEFKNFDTESGQVGISASPNIRPSGKGYLEIKLPANWKQHDVLYVTATDPFERELFTWSFPISKPNKIATSLVVKEGNNKPVLSASDSVYTVDVTDLRIVFNRNSGLIGSVKKGTSEIPFQNGPILEEGVNNFRGFADRYEGNNLIIESTFDRKNSYNVLQWTIYPSGWIKMQVKYFPGDYFTKFVGVNFSLPEETVAGVEYLGNGPYRVWKNRMKGNVLNVWNKDYNNTETGEAPWKYPEFKGYHSNMYWCRFILKNQPSFRVVTEEEDVFFRLFTPAWKDDQWHNYQTIFPKGDISFLQGIPGIGTKTQKAENTGPMGMKNIFYDYEKDPLRYKTLTLYFDFSGK